MDAVLTIFRPLDDWAETRALIYLKDGGLRCDPRKTLPSLRWNAEEHRVANVDEIADVLRNDPGPSVLVQGRLIDPGRRRIFRRSKGPTATLRDGGTGVCIIDFDSVEFPNPLNWPADPEEPARHCRAKLPDAFRRAGCYWYFSASMGFKSGIRIRLMFLLDQNVPLVKIPLWLSMSGCDLSIYGAQSIVLFNRPEIAPGARDPIAVRDGVLAGEPLVRVPLGDLEELQPRSGGRDRSPREAQDVVAPLPAAPHMEGGWDRHLSLFGSEEFGCHNPLRWTIGEYVFRRPADEHRDPDALTRALHRAIGEFKPNERYDAAYLYKRREDAATWAKNMVDVWRQKQASEFEAVESAQEATNGGGGTLHEAADLLGEAVRGVRENVLLLLAARAHMKTDPAAVSALAKIDQQQARHARSADLALSDDETAALTRFDLDAICDALAPACIQSAPGVGKTEALIGTALEVAGEGACVVLAVPSHKNTLEVEERVAGAASKRGLAHEMPAAVFYGIERDGPSGPMCLDRHRATTALGSGLPIRAICGAGDTRCQFADRCAYRGQRRKKPLIWIVTHAQLRTQRPAGVPEPDLLVVDEQFDRDSEPVEIPLSVLATAGRAFEKQALTQQSDAARRLARALENEPDGEPGESDRFRESVTRDDLALLSRFAHRLRPDGKEAFTATLHGGAALDEIGSRNAQALGVLALAGSLKAAVRGEPGRVRIETKDGVRRARVWPRSGIHSGWLTGAVLNLDATADEKLLRSDFGPRATVVAAAKVAKPANVRVVQVATEQNGRITGSHNWLGLNSHTGQPTDLSPSGARAAEILQVARAFAFDVAERVRATTGEVAKVAVIAPQRLKDALKGGIPHAPVGSLVWGHFGNLRGLDEMNDVDGIVIVGRHQLPWHAACDELRSRFGQVPPGESEYAQQWVKVRLSDGSHGLAVLPSYTSPEIEAIVRGRMIAEAEQALGRARWVRRGEHGKPLDVLIINHVPHDILADEMLTWEQALERYSREKADHFGGIVADTITGRILVDRLEQTRSPMNPGETEDDYRARLGTAARQRESRAKREQSPKANVTHSRTSVSAAGLEQVLSRVQIAVEGSRKGFGAMIDPRTAPDHTALADVLAQRSRLLSLVGPNNRRRKAPPEPAPAPTLVDLALLGDNELKALSDELGLRFDVDSVLSVAEISRPEKRRIDRACRGGGEGEAAEKGRLLAMAREIGPERFLAAALRAMRVAIARAAPDRFFLDGSAGTRPGDGNVLTCTA